MNEIGRISAMKACVIKRVRPILYGAPCMIDIGLFVATLHFNHCCF